MLEVSGICKAYGKHRILTGADLSAGPGTCVGIVGKNGCGKTTLLSIMAGALKADSGKVQIGGVDAVKNPKVFADMAAYVPQEPPLIGELSVRDNLLLWFKGNRTEMEKDLESGTSAVLGIGEMLKKRAETLSGGMKKRLGIACALSNHAPLLILDEPGAALDMECKEEIRSWLKTYMTGGGTVVLTSHEQEELALCTELYVLKEGKLKQIETSLTAKELIRQF